MVKVNACCILLAWSIVISVCTTARAGIVMSQQPDQGFGPSADTEFYTSTGLPFWQQLADNFQIGADATIRQIGFWGFYGGDGQPHLPPEGPEAMRVRVYGARAGDGAPDEANIISEQFFLNPVRVATGQTIAVQGRPAEFRFDLDLDTPIPLEESEVYWLEVVQIGDIQSHFRWESSASGVLPGHAFINPLLEDWRIVPASGGNFAFELSTIPEPSALAMLACVSASCRIRRKPRARR